MGPLRAPLCLPQLLGTAAPAPTLFVDVAACRCRQARGSFATARWQLGDEGPVAEEVRPLLARASIAAHVEAVARDLQAATC